MEDDFLPQYFVNFLLITIHYLLLNLKSIWILLNDYAYWRAGIIFVLSYFIAGSLSKDIPALIAKISGWLKFGLGESVAELTKPLIFRLVLLAGIFIAFNSVKLPETTSAIMLSVVMTVVIVSVFFFANKLAHLTLHHVSNEDRSSLIQPKTLPVFEYTAIVFLGTAALYSAFNVWGVELTALLASLGVAGLAIGMAAKDTLSDIIAGVLILTDSPFVLGDTIDIKGESGKITHIGLRNTRVKTAQNIEIVIPNSKVGASEIINKSSHLRDDLLISLPVKAAYGVDPQIIREILIRVAQNHENIVKRATISVTLEDFNQAQTTFVLSCRVTRGELRAATLSSMRESIYLEFLRHKIEVALPIKEDVAISQFPYIFSNGQPRELHNYNHFRSVS